ncbi:FadR/GntR family transcriptional regulator [Nocardioides albidus]
MLTEARRATQLDEALYIRDPEELLDLLAARRGLERETVRAAALRATEPELVRLDQLTAAEADVLEVDNWHDRIDFHSYIGRISHNKQLVALTEVAFDRRRAALERLIFMVGMRTGNAGIGHDEHRAIADAVRGRDADAAETLMVSHIEAVMSSVSQFARTASPDVIEGLFRQQVPVTGARRALTLTTLINNRAAAREIGAP